MPSYVQTLMNYLTTNGTVGDVLYYSQLILEKNWRAIKDGIALFGL